jgi:hypothetical protein
MEKQKVVGLLKGAGFIAGFWIVNLLASELLINPALSALATKGANEFITNNGSFLALLISLLLTSALAILIIPKSWRVRAYKLILAVSMLIVLVDAFPIVSPWDSSFSIAENVKSIIWLLASLLSHLSIALLLLSPIEYWINVDLEKPIITHKKILIALIVIAVISMMITFGIYISYRAQLGWII